MKIFKDETTAKESCEYVKNNNRDEQTPGSKLEPDFRSQTFLINNKV